MWRSADVASRSFRKYCDTISIVMPLKLATKCVLSYRSVLSPPMCTISLWEPWRGLSFFVLWLIVYLSSLLPPSVQERLSSINVWCAKDKLDTTYRRAHNAKTGMHGSYDNGSHVDPTMPSQKSQLSLIHVSQQELGLGGGTVPVSN